MKGNMNVSQYLEEKAFAVLGLLPALTPTELQKMTFVNDFEEIVKQNITEYNTWYAGDSDALLDFYNYNARIEYRTEYYHYKNKRDYFWSRATLESGIKRTHSGFIKNAIDTIVYICGIPVADVDYGKEEGTVLTIGGTVPAKEALQKIIKENDFWGLYQKVQMPMTMVEGWGAYKIHWNVDVYGTEPVITYYRAENVRIYKRFGRVLGITFLDWYKDKKGNRYLAAETRVFSYKGKGTFYVDCFQEMSGGQLMPISSEEGKKFLPKSGVVYTNMPCLFAEPCVFYEDNLHGLAGKSLLEGKIDLLDDLDQAISQASNTVRRSTPVQVFDIDYAERDKKGFPKLPNLFECRFINVQGKKNALGEAAGLSKPVEVIQPDLNTQMYDDHINSLERLIIAGILAPATLGLDVAKKDNGDAQREKEKVTVFTRDHMCREESKILKSLFRQALISKEYLATGKVTKVDWDISVNFDDFADASYENKIQTLSAVLANDGISPKMYVEKVYGDTLSAEDKNKEIEWLESKHKQQQAPQENPFGDEDMSGFMPEGQEAEGEPEAQEESRAQ